MDEDEGTVQVCAVIDQGQIQGAVIVNIDTRDNVALAGSDYTALQNIALTFEAPSTTACTDIVITNDQLYEIDENFFGSLTSPDPTRVTINPARDEASIEIIDEDGTSLVTVVAIIPLNQLYCDLSLEFKNACRFQSVYNTISKMQKPSSQLA